MTTWFTSDLHLGHANLLKNGYRPFKDIEDMDSTLINNWNKKVAPDDTVFCLGDLTLQTKPAVVKDYIYSLNGFIILIKGNHDKWTKKWANNSDSKVNIFDYYEIKYNTQFYVLSHYPFQTWNKSHYGSIHLHGHCHGSLGKISAPNRLDVGVDCHNYAPINIFDINSFLNS
jgi:calcineurin-like phosphoesterase family protein